MAKVPNKKLKGSYNDENECRPGYTLSCVKNEDGSQYTFCMSTECSDNSKESCLPDNGCHWESTNRSCVTNYWENGACQDTEDPCTQYNMSENCERAPENCEWKNDMNGVGYCKSAY